MTDERMGDVAQMAQRYARRRDGDRFQPLRPEIWHGVQERQRAILRGLARRGVRDASPLHLVEVGCGAGADLLEFLRWGFLPEHLAGIELLPDRLAIARSRLPPAVRLMAGDATVADIADASQDIVFQSTVFSSLLEDETQERLAAAMWRWLRPGGVVLWYDLALDNPANPDVRGVPPRRLRALFPEGRIDARRVTLARPLARRVCAMGDRMYDVFNALPVLRTHRLAWIEKSDPAPGGGRGDNPQSH